MDALVRPMFHPDSWSDEGVQPTNGITTEARYPLTGFDAGLKVKSFRA